MLQVEDAPELKAIAGFTAGDYLTPGVHVVSHDRPYESVQVVRKERQVLRPETVDVRVEDRGPGELHGGPS